MLEFQSWSFERFAKAEKKLRLHLGKFVSNAGSLDLSLWYDIQSIPTLIYFVEGTLRFQMVGTATKGAILNKLKAFGFVDQPDALVKDASGAGTPTLKGGLV